MQVSFDVALNDTKDCQNYHGGQAAAYFTDQNDLP